MGTPASDLAARLRLLVLDLIDADLRSGWVPDVADAVDLAADLLVAEKDTPATVEVAGLSRDTSFRETRPVIVQLLAEQGLLSGDSREVDAYAMRLDAFERGLLGASDLEGPFYEQLVEWDAQGPLDRALVVLFDERDHETGSARRDVIEERMREAIRGHRL